MLLLPSWVEEKKLGGDAVIFKGTNVSTNQAYGVTVSYNSNLNKFTINSATTGEKILADGAVGVTETTTASNIEVGRLAITAGVATAMKLVLVDKCLIRFRKHNCCLNYSFWYG